ncbi:retrovirus-related pol polyprotein from transposon TNT 1-94, partial [Tanacetum coccineum]
IVELILFIVDSGCTKHMTGNLKLLCNFVEKYLCTVHFGNDQFAPIIDLQGNDLLTGNRGSDLYIISLQETTSSTPTSFMAKASPTQAWLWHQKLSHLNFDYINLLSMKDVVIGSPKLKYVKDQLYKMKEQRGIRLHFGGILHSSKGISCLNNENKVDMLNPSHLRFYEIKEMSESLLLKKLQASFPNDQKRLIMTT